MSALDRRTPPEPGPPGPFEFPGVRRGHLDNGLTVLAARHGGLPLVAVRVVVRGGGAADAIEQAGLAWLTTACLDTGTDRHDGPELALALERLGIQLEAHTHWDSVMLEASVPASRLDAALELLAEISRRAAFPADDLDRMRAEQLAALLQRRAEPRALADDAAIRFIFAESSRYAYPLVGTRTAIEALAREDAAGFHARWFAPPSVALVMAGAIDETEARTLAERHFGDWRGEATPLPRFSVAARTEAVRIDVVDRPGAVQSEIRVGHSGVPRSHPDQVPLLVMNTILGGAFTSRLNLNLRERHGFTYGARSAFGFRRNGGSFTIATAVGTDVTARAVEEITGEVRRMHDTGAADDEVANARDYLTGVMPLELQTAEDVADQLALLFVHDLPDDWHRAQREAIAALPPADVSRVAAAHLRPDGLSITVVGAADTIAEPLSALGLGPVNVHEVEP